MSLQLTTDNELTYVANLEPHIANAILRVSKQGIFITIARQAVRWSRPGGMG